MTEIPRPDNDPNPSEEKEKSSVDDIIAWGEKALKGEFSGHLQDFEEVGETEPVEGGFEVGDTVVLDLNDVRYSDEEKERLRTWIEGHLGESLETSPIRFSYLSPDGETTFKVFEKRFGTEDDPWYFSQWQNQGEEPSYILWSEEMYDQQEEFGYTRIDQEQGEE